MNTPENDLHHAVLLANLILDRAVTLDAGCQQLSKLLHRLDMDRVESYRAISDAGSATNLRAPLIPYSRHYQNKDESYAQKREELAAFNRTQYEVFAACRALVQELGGD